MSEELTLDVKVANPTRVYGEEVLAKRRAVRARAGSVARIRMTLLDHEGRAIDLNKHSSSSSSSSSDGEQDSSIKLGLREAARGGTTYRTAAVIVDAENGIVEAPVPKQVLSTAAIYWGEMAILDSSGCPIHGNELYLYCEQGLWNDDGCRKGPPPIDEIRLSFRDNDPMDNLLIETYDFDLAELCYAVTRTVLDWNSSPPLLSCAVYDTSNFPFEELWMLGVKIYLSQMAEEHYRRNFLRHHSGNTTIDDKNKWAEYRTAWQDHFGLYKNQIRMLKGQINVNNAWASFGSRASGFRGRR